MQQRTDVDGFEFWFALANEVMDPTNYITGALRLHCELLQHSGHFFDIELARLRLVDASCRIAGDGGERLIELMGKCRSHLTHCDEPGRTRQLLGLLEI